MEFKNYDDAARTLATMNGHPFDAKHTFSITRFTDFERYLNMDEAYEAPAPEEYQPKVCYVHEGIGIGNESFGRNTCVLGSEILKAAINTLHTAETKSISTGMANPRSARCSTAKL